MDSGTLGKQGRGIPLEQTLESGSVLHSLSYICIKLMTQKVICCKILSVYTIGMCRLWPKQPYVLLERRQKQGLCITMQG